MFTRSRYLLMLFLDLGYTKDKLSFFFFVLFFRQKIFFF